MTDIKTKSLGAAIDEIVNALAGLNAKDHLVAINAACAHLSLPFPSIEKMGGATSAVAPTVLPITQLTMPTANLSPSTLNARDIRSLKEEKKPASDREMACIVAYYLQDLAPENERKDTIGTADLTKYFNQANYPSPLAIGQALTNAKVAGYFDSVGRGSFRLNPVGRNLVVHGLPRTEGTTPKGVAKLRTKKKSIKAKR